jgi:hypothetical protein
MNKVYKNFKEYWTSIPSQHFDNATFYQYSSNAWGARQTEIDELLELNKKLEEIILSLKGGSCWCPHMNEDRPGVYFHNKSCHMAQEFFSNKNKE